MKFYDVEWQVWEHGTLEDRPHDGTCSRIIADGKIRKQGASAEALKAEWSKSIKIVYPESTATTTREYIFKAVEVTEVKGWRHCVTCQSLNECEYHQECRDSERFTLDGLPKPGVRIIEQREEKTTAREDALLQRGFTPPTRLTFWHLVMAAGAVIAIFGLVAGLHR